MRAGAFVTMAIAAGFALGFLWGRGTRSALPQVTSTSFDGGVFSLRVDTGKALAAGLGELWR